MFVELSSKLLPFFWKNLLWLWIIYSDYDYKQILKL